MAYIGTTPADKYTSFAVQHFTTSATTSYTLDNSVANENEIALFINNVRQQPGSSYAYTASGTTLTLSAATSASDTMYCVFIGKAVQTVTPANGSVTGAMMSYPLTTFSSTGIDDNADATAITIDSSENVGIGTSSPSQKLEISDTGVQNVVIKVTNNDGNAEFQKYQDDLYLNLNDSGNIIVRSGTSITERMRIEDDGDIRLASSVGIGSYTTNSGNWVSNNIDGGQDFRVGTLVTSADTSVIHIINKTTTGSGNMMAFRIQGSTKGTISTDGSSTSYNTTSDYRLKENVVDVVDATARLKQLQPKRFNFIEQPNKTVDGFLAHEVSSIVPEAITGTKDEIETYTDKEGNEQTRPVYQNIDQSKLVPLLTASLKEAIAKIEELETRIATLEGI